MPDYLTEAHGPRPSATGKVLSSKLTYSFVRSFGQQPRRGRLRNTWRWYNSPFGWRNQILRNPSVGACLIIEVHETHEEFKNPPFSFGYSIWRAAFERPPDHHGWIVARYR